MVSALIEKLNPLKYLWKAPAPLPEAEGIAPPVKHSHQLREQASYGIEGIHALVIDFQGDHLSLSTGDHREVQLVFEGDVLSTDQDPLPRLEVSQQKGTLFISLNLFQNPIEQPRSLSLGVALPQGFKGSLKVVTLHSSLELEKLSLEAFHFESITGSLRIQQLYVKEAVLKTETGEIFIGEAQGAIQMETTTGAMHLHHSGSENLQLDTVTGSGDLQLTHGLGTLIQETITGNLKNRLSPHSHPRCVRLSSITGSFSLE